ncbi:MAG: biotin carboxylase, partial [Halioglobus sp.]|nr:biotin carboxylase [Halioglobus sp.]
SELCYALRFRNPEDTEDYFDVLSVVEMMGLLARHKERLPKPERIRRDAAAVEARLNATDRSLSPHAGGEIIAWSHPIEGEIRDDQGISLHNPDTDVFMKYTLAGAYDSNIALLLTVGESRLQTYENMAETIRQTRMRGQDLATNLEFHYGLVNWFIGQNINARPTTRFIVPYLTAVGELKQQANNLDVDFAYSRIGQALLSGPDEEAQAALAHALQMKESLLLRPLKRLLDEPHVLSGWLSLHRDCCTLIDGRFCWNENPVELLAETYHFLNMDHVPGDKPPAASMIWDHDDAILQQALAFYAELDQRLGAEDWIELCSLLEANDAPEGFDESLWQRVRAAHCGFQAGCDVLAMLPAIAEKTGFYALSVNSDLTIHIPERLTDSELQAAMAKVLVPPPVASSDEILAQSGGMFYSRETPEHDVYVKEGDHFEAGDPLFIVEVMKMFNKVYAPFAGTIKEVLVDTDGTIISKGQPIFKITPDEVIEQVSPEEIAARRREGTVQFLKNLQGETA